MVSQYNSHVNGVTPEELVDILKPESISLNASADKIVYVLRPFSEKGDRPVSSIWIADVGKAKSARQITSGLHDEKEPKWSPDGKTIAFISDRARKNNDGNSSAIFILSLEGGEAYPVTDVGNEMGITRLQWSPNGKFIAFLSPEEKNPDRKRREEEKDDVKVYGQDRDVNVLRLLHVPTRDCESIPCGPQHVVEFTWTEDSTELAFMATKDPDLDSAGYHGTSFYRISSHAGHLPTKITHFPGLASSVAWLGSDLFFQAGASPTKSNTSAMVYRLSLLNGKWERNAYGKVNCIDGLRRVGDVIAVKVLHGLSDEIHTLSSTSSISIRYAELHEIEHWDVAMPESEPILIIAKSSVSSPTEIYSITSGVNCQLTSHNISVSSHKFGQASPLYTTATDGTALDSVLLTPHSPETDKPYPTVMLVHGGPYSRVNNRFDVGSYTFAPYLLSAGYCILSPNYRGGSSHGEKYASGARSAMGTVDYSDIIDLLKAGIACGIIDEKKVIIGGWSQGGFLSYLATTKNSFKFQGAICGAGVTDWDMMSITSDVPFFESELAGSAPWDCPRENTDARKGSPIWDMKKVKTPILILHGEQDVRVPLTQAIAFQRGCERWGVPYEMAVYPREGHWIAERMHRIDMLKRVRRFVDKYLSG
jgi:dipeptidyl aminopeptidase/acylaminoacyl peptidase